MGMIYGMLALLFALVFVLYILVIKCMIDFSIIKDLYKINNEYVKQYSKDWTDAINLCHKICNLNEELIDREDKKEVPSND